MVHWVVVVLILENKITLKMILSSDKLSPNFGLSSTIKASILHLTGERTGWTEGESLITVCKKTKGKFPCEHCMTHTGHQNFFISFYLFPQTIDNTELQYKTRALNKLNDIVYRKERRGARLDKLICAP